MPDNVTSQLIFMQDGAPPHIYRPVKQLLTNFFGPRIISRHFPDQWPPRSPDMNPLDYWLWGYLKSKVFLQAPRTTEELKEAIRKEISKINANQLTNAVQHFKDRVSAVVENKGGHFEHLM